MVCFRYIIVNTVHKVDNKDNNRTKWKVTENRGNLGMGIFEEVEGAEI
jgi:hypothetical protein